MGLETFCGSLWDNISFLVPCARHLRRQGLLSRFDSVYRYRYSGYITQRGALAQGVLWWVAMSLRAKCFFFPTHVNDSMLLNPVSSTDFTRFTPLAKERNRYISRKRGKPWTSPYPTLPTGGSLAKAGMLDGGNPPITSGWACPTLPRQGRAPLPRSSSPSPSRTLACQLPAPRASS